MGAKKTIITVICCICGKIIEKKDGQGVTGISHGYCEACASKEMERYKRLKRSKA